MSIQDKKELNLSCFLFFFFQENLVEMLPKEMYFKLTAPFYMIFQDECKIYNVMGKEQKGRHNL